MRESLTRDGNHFRSQCAVFLLLALHVLTKNAFSDSCKIFAKLVEDPQSLAELKTSLAASGYTFDEPVDQRGSEFGSTYRSVTLRDAAGQEAGYIEFNYA